MTRYPIIGDLDKPFHRPECECELCEKWREQHDTADAEGDAMGYSYSVDEELFYGDFDTCEQAVQEGFRDEPEAGVIFVGEGCPPIQPEMFWDASDWLEHVSCQDEYSGDYAEGWDRSTKEQRAELEKEVQAVLAAWLDRHGLRPTFRIIENATVHRRPRHEVPGGAK